MHPKSFVDRAPPGPGGGAYNAPPRPIAGFKGLLITEGRRGRVRREQGTGGEGRGRDLADQCEIASYAPALI